MRKIAGIFILFAILIVSGKNVFGLAVGEVQNPKVTSDSFVEDSAGVLGPDYISLIDGICKNLEAKTSAEMAVVTVDNLGGTTVEDFAVRLFKGFGIGKKGKDNGLLILFARDDRKIRIEVGYGLEGAVNDAKAGRFMDTYAVPKFKEGEYARGLYDLAKVVAEEVAKASGATLDVTDPATWPAQIETVSAEPVQKSAPEIKNVSQAVLIYVASVLSIAFFGLATLSLRVGFKKAKAAKKAAMGNGGVLPVIALFVGAVAMFIIGSAAEKILLPLAGYLGTGFAVMFSQIMIRRRLERYIKNYHLDCPKCKTAMDLVDEISDNKFLSVEELAEEQAYGMDYEFWKCPKCEAVERFNVKLPKAGDCPKCKRRSVKTTKTTLVAATTSSSGKERITYKCSNPKCDYIREVEKKIPRISSSSGGSGSSGSSGGSSFGGGSSGGGGSSRGW